MEEQNFLTNLEYYKVFYYVALYGSMTTAAEKLCLTQPTVTSTIRRLESQLGTPLFVRNRRGVILNAEGRVLWNRVEPACRLLLCGERELEDIRSLNGGTLRIASTEMSFRAYVLPVLKEYAEDFPNVKIRFRNDLTGAILDMLRDGTVDLAILHTPFSADEQMELRKLDEIEECFVAGQKYRWLAEQPRTLAELQGLPIISVPEGANTQSFATELFRQKGLKYEPDIEVTTIELVIQSVIYNLGLAMLPRKQFQKQEAAGLVFRIPVRDVQMVRTAYIVTCKKFPVSPSAEVFLEDYLLPAYEQVGD